MHKLTESHPVRTTTIILPFAAGKFIDGRKKFNEKGESVVTLNFVTTVVRKATK